MGKRQADGPSDVVLLARARIGLHISDHRLAAFIHMHMLDADDLRAAVSQAPQRFDLGCVGAQQSCRRG
jgi:citrate lyase beta subunit